MDNQDRIHTLHTQETIDNEASLWLTRLDRGKLSRREKIEFKKWLSQDPDNVMTIKQMALMWNDMDTLLNKIPDNFIRSNINHVGFVPNHMKVGAVVILFISALAFYFITSQDLHDEINHEVVNLDQELKYYSTDIGGQKSQVLSDGTIATLNTNSIIEAELSNEKRIIRLLQGESMFDVSHDPNRPFIVFVGNTQVVAIGTKFVVRMSSENIVVTVTEGKVQISKRINSSEDPLSEIEITDFKNDPIIVSQGEEIFVDDRQPNNNLKNTLDKDGINRRLSWVDGQLIFKDETLESVINEVSRYVPVQIMIDDQELKSKKISGRFKIGDTEALLEAIEVTFKVQISYLDDQVIQLNQ